MCLQVCPVCFTKVGMDMVDHITTEHRTIHKISFLFDYWKLFIFSPHLLDIYFPSCLLHLVLLQSVELLLVLLFRLEAMSTSLIINYSLQKLKLGRVESHSNYSFLKKDLEDGYLQSLLSGSSSVVSSSNLAPDPLLSFICNVSPAEKYDSVQPSCSSKATIEEKSSDEKLLERLVVWLCFMTSVTCVLMFVPIIILSLEKKNQSTCYLVR